MKITTFILILIFSVFSLIYTNEENLIKIDKKLREVSVEGSFHISKGVLEFAVASEKSNRDYESFILINAKPSQLLKALKEIGLQAPTSKNTCHQLKIKVTWTFDGKEFTRELSEFLIPNQKKEIQETYQWCFSGSEWKDDKIKEDDNGEVIALQPGINGIIHISRDFGNPYDEDHAKGFRVNAEYLEKLFPKDTLGDATSFQKIPLRLIISVP